LKKDSQEGHGDEQDLSPDEQKGQGEKRGWKFLNSESLLF